MNNTDFSDAAVSLASKPQAEASTAFPPDVVATRHRAKFLAAVVLGAELIGGPLAPPFTHSYRRRKDDYPAESSTRAMETDPVLLQDVKDLFEKGASEFFQDGMDSDFSRTLLRLLGSRGTDALAAIAQYLSWDEANPAVVSEALRWLADFGGPETLRKRWTILRRALRSRYPAIRDAAILGFSVLDDPRARSLLLEARKSEQIHELQSLIGHVAARLER